MTLFENIKASLFRFCSDFADTNATEQPITLYNFDAFTEENTLPMTDLIGPYRTSVDINGGLVTVTTMLGIATLEDQNLFRLDRLAGMLLQVCSPSGVIPLIDGDSGQQIGHLNITNDVSLSPSLRAKERPLKLLHLTLKSDLASFP